MRALASPQGGDAEEGDLHFVGFEPGDGGDEFVVAVGVLPVRFGVLLHVGHQFERHALHDDAPSGVAVRHGPALFEQEQRFIIFDLDHTRG